LLVQVARCRLCSGDNIKIKRDINLPPAPRHVDAMFNLRPPLPLNPRVPATAEQRVQFNALNTRLRAFAAARGTGRPLVFAP
jgi:hypothetical protein